MQNPFPEVSFSVQGFKPDDDQAVARPTCLFSCHDPKMAIAAGECMAEWELVPRVCWTSFVGIPESGIMTFDEFKATYGDQAQT